MSKPFVRERLKLERRFVVLLAFACVLVAALPAVAAMLRTTSALRYTGFQTNVDDHMVYAAWTWQAAHGAITFDDRFAVEPQPGLTFHLYFFLLGQIARFTGVVAAMTFGRLLFTGLFVSGLARFVRRLRPDIYGLKLALFATVVAGGLGFLPFFWHQFGVEGPIDVWQPEGFVMSSMLTNGLFMVSLWLILNVFTAVLSARKGSRSAVIGGALSMAALMNIHSYDALTVGLVLLGFLAASLASRTMTLPWLGRGVLIVLGAAIPALWFVHVLQEDPVFRARAATETYSPNFRQVLLGYLPAMVLAFVGLYRRAAVARTPEARKRQFAGLALAVGLILGLAALAAGHTPNSYFLSAPGWALAYVVAVAAVALLAERSPARNLIVAWALVGTVAIYFPALFQRKLTMGLSIPWALLASMALVETLRDRERSARNLVTTLALVVLGGSAFQWFFRELAFVRTNVSSTARHPVLLSPDVQKIVDYLNAQPGRKVAIAFPGTNQPEVDEAGHPIPDRFQTPSLPDVAPFLSGLAGVYTFDGHWSETPDYPRRAGLATRFMLAQPIGNTMPMTAEERKALIDQYGLNYAVVPVLPFIVKPSTLGEVVVPGTQFALVRLSSPG